MNGGLLTEFIPGTLPDRENFPKRNRIIAGLCDALVVVEASAKGGALITAELANSYFKEVYAFPGRVTDRYSEGCNFLIKTHRAAMINSAEDLIFELGWEKPDEKEMAEPILNGDRTEEVQRVIAVLKQKKQHIDEIVIHTGISQGELVMILLELEMTGVIMALPGNFFELP
ncbi:DNA protecting protein DprA [compost metagenome]